MEKLTGFERALLAEFESLAAACERSGAVSADTAARLSQASRHFSSQIATLRERQSALEERLDAVNGRTGSFAGKGEELRFGPPSAPSGTEPTLVGT